MPEFLLSKAVQDWSLAKTSVEEMKDLASQADFEWLMAHGFYANMGGFALKARSSVKDRDIPSPIFLNLRSLKYVCGEGYVIERLPRITKDEIRDKSNGDFFVKTIAGIQLCCSFVQAVMRGTKGLAVTPLEIAVLAYAACTLIALFFLLEKPKNVKVPTIIPVKADLGEKRISIMHRSEIERLRPQSWFDISLRLSQYYRPHQPSISVLSPIPNDARYAHRTAASAILPREVLLTGMDNGFTIAGIVFGGIHCAA